MIKAGGLYALLSFTKGRYHKLWHMKENVESVALSIDTAPDVMSSEPHPHGCLSLIRMNAEGFSTTW